MISIGLEILTFKVAIGRDGAPFGKNDQSCAWLISFLNIGKHFLSNEDNFFIFGANCSEICTTVDKYVSKLANYLAYLEKNVIQVNGANVKFEFSKLPNRKMLCFLAGQLSNRAKYFLQMYLVITSTLKFTFDQSKGHNGDHGFYQKRLNGAKQVTDLKVHLIKSKLTKNSLGIRLLLSLLKRNQDENTIHELEH